MIGVPEVVLIGVPGVVVVTVVIMLVVVTGVADWLAVETGAVDPAATPPDTVVTVD